MSESDSSIASDSPDYHGSVTPSDSDSAVSVGGGDSPQPSETDFSICSSVSIGSFSQMDLSSDDSVCEDSSEPTGEWSGMASDDDA